MEEPRRVRGDAPVRARVSRPRARSTACASIIPTACSIRPSTSRACRTATPRAPGSSARRDPRLARSTSWSRRSPRRTSDVPSDWRVHGTTGYRFADVVNGLFVDTDGERGASTRTWRAFTRERRRTFGEIALPEASARSCAPALAAELHRARERPCCASPSGDRRTRDYTLNSLRHALAEIAACFPVYRTYVVDARRRRTDRYIDWAVAHARRRSPLADLSVFDFVRSDCCATSRPTRRRPSRRPRCGASRGASSSSRAPVDRQGRRGHRVLPSINRLVVAERGRRRSATTSA